VSDVVDYSQSSASNSEMCGAGQHRVVHVSINYTQRIPETSCVHSPSVDATVRNIYG